MFWIVQWKWRILQDRYNDLELQNLSVMHPQFHSSIEISILMKFVEIFSCHILTQQNQMESKYVMKGQIIKTSDLCSQKYKDIWKCWVKTRFSRLLSADRPIPQLHAVWMQVRQGLKVAKLRCEVESFSCCCVDQIIAWKTLMTETLLRRKKFWEILPYLLRLSYVCSKIVARANLEDRLFLTVQYYHTVLLQYYGNSQLDLPLAQNPVNLPLLHTVLCPWFVFPKVSRHPSTPAMYDMNLNSNFPTFCNWENVYRTLLNIWN